MRLQKFLAQKGLGSRRTIEGWITASKIKVNGTIAQLGQTVGLGDVVTLDGKDIPFEPLPASTTPRVLVYHKLEGEICSQSTEDGKPRVFDSLPALEVGRWVMVGRLDVNTSGLLLFTDDGELAHRLMHPSFEIVRRYSVRVLGEVSDQTLLQLRKGVMLSTGMSAFKEITPMQSSSGANKWFTVTLSSGKYREVRELFASQGCTVSRLIRTHYGPIALPPSLGNGKWQELDKHQVQSLLEAVAKN